MYNEVERWFSMALIGLFLIVMGIAMFGMGIVYQTTSNLGYSWGIFGFIYSFGLFGVLFNSTIQTLLNAKITNFPIVSIMILALGIILSYVLFAKRGGRYVILSILFVVGIHFLPFNSIVSSILAVLICLNALVGFYLKKAEIATFIFSDGVLKVITGVVCLIGYMYT